MSGEPINPDPEYDGDEGYPPEPPERTAAYVVVEYTPQELDALLDKLADVELDYTDLGHALLKLQQAKAGEQPTTVEALRQIVELLGRNGGGRGRDVVDTGSDALAVARGALAMLGIEP